MERFFTKITLFLLISLMLVSSGQAYKKVKCFVLMPPEQVLPGVQRIAVLDFEGEGKYGEVFSGYLITKLIESDRGIHDLKTGFLGMGKKEEGETLQEGAFTNVFHIVERSRIMEVIEEQQLSMSGLLDQSQAVSLGQMLGVQAIVMGNVVYNYSDDNFKEERTFKKDGKRQKKLVDCKKRKVNAVVGIRIISAETGQILGSTEATQSMEDKKCEGMIKNIRSIEEMVDACLKDLSGKIANYLSPHFELQTYELEKIKTDRFKDLAEEAAELAEELNIDQAFLKYHAIYEKDPYNPQILYNLGIMHEVVGNFQKADEFYQMAYQLNQEGKYKEALDRVRKNVEFTQTLAAMGVEIKEHEFVVTKEDIAQALAKKVEINGKREERFNIYAEPREGSQVVAQVPGGVTFTVIRQEGDWYFLQLLGDQKGYIHKNYVKAK
ncbi:MAG: hypothetical protein Kow0042_14290 [Calditrichia bacterium]